MKCKTCGKEVAKLMYWLTCGYCSADCSIKAPEPRTCTDELMDEAMACYRENHAAMMERQAKNGS